MFHYFAFYETKHFTGVQRKIFCYRAAFSELLIWKLDICRIKLQHDNCRCVKWQICLPPCWCEWIQGNCLMSQRLQSMDVKTSFLIVTTYCTFCHWIQDSGKFLIHPAYSLLFLKWQITIQWMTYQNEDIHSVSLHCCTQYKVQLISLVIPPIKLTVCGHIQRCRTILLFMSGSWCQYHKETFVGTIFYIYCC